MIRKSKSKITKQTIVKRKSTKMEEKKRRQFLLRAKSSKMKDGMRSHQTTFDLETITSNFFAQLLPSMKI